MFLSAWRKSAQSLRETPPTIRRERRRPAGHRFGSGLGVESLEDRTLLSTFQWLGGATGNWNDPANWNRVAGATGTFPNAARDIARFTRAYPRAQTVSVNAGITVGEIDFGTVSNITITATGANVLTLDNTPNANAILNVGAAPFTNTGTDTITAPLAVASGTPLTATVSGGTLQLTSTANVIGGASTFAVNPGATLRASAA